MTIRKTVGVLTAPEGARFALVAARFNEFIVDRLVDGAVDAFLRSGVPREALELVQVPGAWELPVAARAVARRGGVDAIVGLGCVIRGATPHFDYVAGECAKGLSAVSAAFDLPVVFGVLTTDTIEQAIERAGTKAGNKGAEAALTAIEMVNLLRALGEGR
jgi:6,7-dimethyl-8-ribityllumazine synthase